jgi:uncharacterized protein (DUF2249 family)
MADHTPELAIKPDQKVAAVLKQHPALVDVFVAESEAFKRLRNPVMRRTFAHMVTVAQAARVGNVPLPRLLASLNRAVGVEVSEDDLADLPTAEISPPPVSARPQWLATAHVATEIDARDMQKRGEDPFSLIMQGARQTPQGQILLLRNTFSPEPLYDVLGKKGFVHWAEQLGAEDWSISFYREREVPLEDDVSRPPGAEASRAAHRTARPGVPVGGEEAAGEPLFAADLPPADHIVDAVVTIGLEDLVPPMPMQKVLEALAPLQPGQLLLVHHRRLPAHLMAKLDEQGHRYRVWDLEPDRKEILIRKAG